MRASSSFAGWANSEGAGQYAGQGTQAQRAAAVEARNANFKAEFAEAARGSGFGDGAREQVARAMKARDEDIARRNGKRLPGVF
jgi:hypothetical protein